MADTVAQAVEKFAQVLPLDIAEIFTWYFEQKGVENPERFLDQEKLNKQVQTEQVQDVIQDMNIKKQLVQGEMIGKVGNTGHSHGPHLHLTIREGKYQGKAVNPYKYIIKN